MSRWKVLQTDTIFQAGLFKLRVDKLELPDQRVMPRYYVMEFTDWVNVVPITSAGQIVMIEQYRHAVGERFLEIPGGSTNLNEDPKIAGERELLEETGYQGKEWVYCGYHNPNPALQSNRMHTFLALNCEKVAEPNLDPYEEIQIQLMDLKSVLDQWERGEIKHSLISASIALSMRFLKGLP